MRKCKPHEITKCVLADNWDKLRQLANLLPGWVFRGQREMQWRLEPTLERFMKNLRGEYSATEVEQHILTQFRRRAPTYLNDLPMYNDTIGWLALVQHYGGPTRLLDFTKSIYVAAFFALAEQPTSSHAVIWAVNDRVIRGKVESILQMPNGKPVSCADEFEAGDLMNSSATAEFDGYAACAGAPYYLSARLAIQQGLFLFSLNMQHTLEENLYGMFGVNVEDIYPDNLVGWFTNPFDEHLLSKLQRTPIIKIVVPGKERAEILRDLKRMNITYETLFPGIEGFGRSLNHELIELQKADEPQDCPS